MTFRVPRLMVGAVLLLTTCTSTNSTPSAPPDEPIPAAWLQVAPAPKIEALSYGAGGILLQTPRPASTATVRLIDVAGRGKLVNGDKELTPPFPAIDTFDVSLDRREVVFSAKRIDNFDVGLVSLDGSAIRWLPEDPSNEIAVQWAPRGNKVSYVVRARGGDLVRTVHIPTSMQLTTEFLFGRVHVLAWDSRAERYAVAWNSVDASDRVEVMTYAGDERKVATAPAVKLDVEVEPVGGALLLHPAAMRYNEKLPLVVWRTGDRNEWDDARGALEREVRIVCAVIDKDPDPAFWSAVAELPWIDASRVFVIGSRPAQSAAGAPSKPAAATTACSGGSCAVWISGDSSIPAGRYRRIANLVSVSPALVQSFGAAWVAHQLKGNPPANGSHR